MCSTATDFFTRTAGSVFSVATGATAADFDDETLYDVPTTVKFGQMLSSIGYKVTLCPYTNPTFWQNVYNQLGSSIVDAVYLLPSRVHVQTAVHALNAQMIFFVDHQANLLARIDHHAPRALRVGMFAANELPLHEELPINLVQAAHVHIL